MIIKFNEKREKEVFQEFLKDSNVRDMRPELQIEALALKNKIENKLKNDDFEDDFIKGVVCSCDVIADCDHVALMEIIKDCGGQKIVDEIKKNGLEETKKAVKFSIVNKCGNAKNYTW